MNYKYILIACIVIILVIYLFPKGGAEPKKESELGKVGDKKQPNPNTQTKQAKIDFNQPQKASTKLQVLNQIIKYRTKQEDYLKKSKYDKNEKNRESHRKIAFLNHEKAQASENYLNRNYAQLKGIII